MGKINKFANLYNSEGELIRTADPKLKAFSIKELEDYLDTLDKGSNEYNNCMSWLIGMYQHPKTEEDKAYVKQLQEDLIKKIQDESNKKKQDEAAGKTSLEELQKDIEHSKLLNEHEEEVFGDVEDAEIVEPVPDMAEGTNTEGA